MTPGAANHLQVSPSGWLVSGADDGLHVLEATHLDMVDGRVKGATFGLLSASESSRLVARLGHSSVPGDSAPDTPWAAVAHRADGSLSLACSPMLVSGLFLTVERDGRRTRLIAATDPVRVLRTMRGRLNLNQDFIHHFAMFSAAPRGTPFTDIVRVPPGDTVVWRPGQQSITTVEWCGPATLPAPHREGNLVARDYLRTFDAVVADLAARSGPLVATVSGGLDSTFLASSLARVATPENPVHGFCHSPLPEANCTPMAHFDPDDFPLAQLMAADYADLLSVTAMRNTDHIHPLDAALARSELTGWPTSSATNAVWLNDFNNQAASLGATTAFVGVCGNATFSDSHLYASGYYLRRGRVDRSLSLAAAQMGHGQSWRSAMRSRVFRPLRQSPPANSQRWVTLGLRIPVAKTHPSPSRDTYLAWCSGHLHSMAGSLNPASAPGILLVDPFASRAVIELAAEIEPRHWQRGAPDRAFARQVAKGRVPEAIRTRRRRGGQGRDAWYVVSRDLDRLDRALAHVRGSQVLSEVLDLDIFTRVVAGLRKRPEHDPPSHIDLEDLLRILALGEYLHWVDAEFGSAVVPAPGIRPQGGLNPSGRYGPAGTPAGPPLGSGD